jgi:hypothetical protein
MVWKDCLDDVVAQFLLQGHTVGLDTDKKTSRNEKSAGSNPAWRTTTI